MPWAVIGSFVYPASPTRAQPGPKGFRKAFGTAAAGEPVLPGGRARTRSANSGTSSSVAR